jgi:hypothetical protein
MLAGMREFRGEDLSGSVFHEVDLSGARLSEVHLDDVVVRGAWGGRVDLDGAFDELLYNGIDLIPLWREELTRQHPEFALIRPGDAEGYRTVWPALEGLWDSTLARARALPEPLLHEQVEGEWSFVQTLRHLVFVTDSWLRRAVLGETGHVDPLGLAHEDIGRVAGVPDAGDVRPPLEEVLALREERNAIVRAYLADLTDEQLGADAVVTGPGYPEAGTYATARCLGAVVSEEWWHHRFAERDLSVLEDTHARAGD